MRVTAIYPAEHVTLPPPIRHAIERVMAGFPSPAQDYQSTPLDFVKLIGLDPTATWYVDVAGHSMTDAGLLDGDVAIVNLAGRPADGKIVVAALDADLTVKRLRVTPSGVMLCAENPDYPPIVVPELSELVILGVVRGWIHLE